MAVAVSFTVLGVTGFRTKIARVDERAQDMRPVFRVIGHKWIRWNQQQFDSEGARGGHPWAQLAAATVKNRKSAHPILKVSGGLEYAMTSARNIHIRDRSMHFLIRSDVRAEKLAGIHYAGDEPRMPARRPINFTQLDRREMNKDMTAWVTSGRL